MIKNILIIWLLFTPLICNAQNDNLSFLLTEKYLSFIDSLTLEVPVQFTPKFVYDFAFSKNYIYLLGESKYPILKFTRTGKFVRAVGKTGNGPGEFRITPLKIAANESSDNFVVIDGPFGISLYFYNSEKKIKQYTNMAYFGFVDVELFNDIPVIVCSSNSEKHIKVLDKSFKIDKSFIDLPGESKVLGSVRTPFWGIQKTGKVSFLSHPGYPFQIYNNRIDINTHDINSSKLSVTHNDLSDFHAPVYKAKLSIGEYKKYSSISWLIGNEKYLLGTFFGYDENGKSITETFLVKDNKLIQKWHLNIDDLLSIIPVGNQLMVHKYRNFEKSSDMTLSFWKLKEM